MKETGRTRLLGVLAKENRNPPPVWIMRQAGRYLPEYRALRTQAGSFWAMCMTPELAAEVTLQPVARFDLDAAIVFSDILTVPFALGCDVRFEEGTGPSLAPVVSSEFLERDVEIWADRLRPCYDALGLVRQRLGTATTLLGFAGAPWTLATYMVQGHGSSDQRAAKLWGYRDPGGFAALLDVIGDCVAQHLIAQLAAGADAVQIFDSWASGLPDFAFEKWVVGPTKRIVSLVRTERPDAKIIGFPRATTLRGYERYARETGVDAVSLDTAVPLDWAAQTLTPHVAVQGNLDPIILVAGGAALRDETDRILSAMKDRPFIFNLGHGVLPETPPEHVDELVGRIRGGT
jgi:uroporphyrinogen decarboxylase